MSEAPLPGLKVGIAWTDVFSGLYTVIAIQAALAERARSGLGQHIDMALFDTGLSVLANQSASALLTNASPTRLGNRHPGIVPYEVFATKDGDLIIACGNDRQFSTLCSVLGLSALASEPAYASNTARVTNRDDLFAKLSSVTETWTKSDLIDALESAGVPVGPINTVAEAFDDPQAIARDIVIAPEGRRGVRSPSLFSRSALAFDKAAPALGDGAWSFGSKKDT